MKYFEANTLDQLARKVTESGLRPIGPPVPKITKHGKQYTTVTWWVQAVTE